MYEYFVVNVPPTDLDPTVIKECKLQLCIVVNHHPTEIDSSVNLPSFYEYLV